ncbi:MAG: T9SS type A sorting domain-containing protein [Bacteroidia bacterium]|nr:T9SS type A sorting domain-containing protein [Bacteroidia bacterium]
MLKWGKYALLVSLLFMVFQSRAQTDPAPFDLSLGNYSFTSWLSTSPAGTYPANMYLHTCSQDSNPALGDPTTGNYSGAYNVGTGNRFAGLGATGLSVFNKSKTPATIGAAVLGLNTTGRTNISVSWVTQAVAAGNAYNLRLQYRVSTVSPWLDVPGPVEYVYVSAPSAAQTISVNLSTATANAVDNRPNMQLRWKYYYVSGFTASSNTLTLDEINVSSLANAGNSIATGIIGGSPFCVSPSTGSTVNVPFTYAPAAGFGAGSCTFTAELSNSAGQFTTPTTIGTLVSNASGTQSISAVLPPGLGTGTAYRIRVTSDVPAITGNDNGADLTIRLSPFDVTSATTNCLNNASTVSWALPAGCYDEIMVVARDLAPVTGTPSGNGSAYTPNTVYGSGTSFGGGYVVYRGAGTNVNITNLANSTVYYYKIWVRYGSEWSSGEEIFCTPGAGTLLKRGDFAIVGINANNGSCGFNSGADEISFVCFRDISTGTTLDLTDNGWQRVQLNRWGNSEGTVRMTRTGATIPAGTIITIRFDGAGNGNAVTPDAAWSFININLWGTFNLNNGGDQIFFMQGGNWVSGANNAHDAIYTGTVLFGFNTKSAWWSPPTFPQFNSATPTQESYPYPNLDCYSISPSVGSDWIKFTGTLPGSLNPKTQRNWVDSINDAAKWVRHATCAAYNTASPNWLTQTPLTIIAGGYMAGKWVGAKSTNWFTCDNWEDFVVPDSNTNVWIPPSGVTFICRLQLDSSHYCRDLTIDGYEVNGADTNTRILRIYGNLNINGGELDFSDNNPNTRDGLIYLKGNWTNFNETAFREGNSKVFFEGSALQSINTPIRELFYQADVNNAAGINTGTSMQVQNLLTLTNGLITTGSNEVYITTGNTGAISGYGLTRYISGNLRRQVANSGVYDFPVGYSSAYELATLSIASQAGISNILVDFDAPSPGALPNPALCFINSSPVNGMLDAGSWSISPNATPLAVNLSLTLKERGHTNSVAPATRYGIIRRDDALSDWLGAPLGTHANFTQSEVGGTATAVRSGINTTNFWGDFAIGFGSAPLPVEWLSFIARPEAGKVYLHWKTASESENDYFRVERSHNGLHFEAIGQVAGNGTTSLPSNYAFTDYSPYEGTSYYRIRQVDYNGRTDFSTVVPVRFGESLSGLQISPNPVREQAWLLLQSPENTTSSIELFDPAGKLVYTRVVELQEGSNGIALDMSRFESGMYILKQGRHVLRILKN